MAERELRRMSRTELIEIIYALKQHEEELEQQNAALQKQLDDRTLRLEHAGSIAEAGAASGVRSGSGRCRCVSGIGEGNESAPAQ